MNASETVLINDLAAYRQRSGVGWYVDLLMRHMAPERTGVQLTPLSHTLFGTPLRLLSQVVSRGGTRGAAPTTGLRAKARAELGRIVKRTAPALIDRYLSLVGRARR